MESLTTALTLLCNLVVVGNTKDEKSKVKMKNSDWEIAELGLEDLKILEHNHNEKSIRLMTGKLRTVISAHIAVMDHTKQVS